MPFLTPIERVFENLELIFLNISLLWKFGSACLFSSSLSLLSHSLTVTIQLRCPRNRVPKLYFWLKFCPKFFLFEFLKKFFEIFDKFSKNGIFLKTFSKNGKFSKKGKLLKIFQEIEIFSKNRKIFKKSKICPKNRNFFKYFQKI